MVQNWCYKQSICGSPFYFFRKAFGVSSNIPTFLIISVQKPAPHGSPSCNAHQKMWRCPPSYQLRIDRLAPSLKASLSIFSQTQLALAFIVSRNILVFMPLGASFIDAFFCGEFSRPCVIRLPQTLALARLFRHQHCRLCTRVRTSDTSNQVGIEQYAELQRGGLCMCHH